MSITEQDDRTLWKRASSNVESSIDITQIRSSIEEDFPAAKNYPSSDSSESTVTYHSCYDMSSETSADYRMGELVQKLARIRAPSASFGPFQDQPNTTLPQVPRSRIPWSSFFLELLDGLLQTANERLVYLPTQSILNHIRSLSGGLDTCSMPRLCIVNLELRDVDLIQIPEQEQSQSPRETDSPRSPVDISEFGSLLDHKAAIWADLFFSRVFIDPSPRFLEGVGSAIRNMIGSEDTQLRLAVYVLIHPFPRVHWNCPHSIPSLLLC